VPSDPGDVPTTAQDCWVCLDTAVRGAYGEFDPADSTWYLLEPMFQAVSERLFGFADVGTADAEVAESAALAEPELASAVDAVERSIELLTAGPVEVQLLQQLRGALSALCP
jgi:hypothetical protein